jgi:hypothetical protein
MQHRQHFPSKWIDGRIISYSHDTAARVLLLRLGVEHLAARTQVIALRDELVHLLAALQHALHGLVQHLLRGVELVLDLEDLVCLLGVLVLREVVLELGIGQRVCLGGGDGGGGVLGGELVAEFLEDARDDEVGVFFVGDDYAAKAARVVVGVDEVVWGGQSCARGGRGDAHRGSCPPLWRHACLAASSWLLSRQRGSTVHVRALSPERGRAGGQREEERTYELLDAAAGESVEAAQLALVYQLDGVGAIGGAPDLDMVVRCERTWWGGEGGLTPMYRTFMLMVAAVWTWVGADGVLVARACAYGRGYVQQSGCLRGVGGMARRRCWPYLGFHVLR